MMSRTALLTSAVGLALLFSPVQALAGQLSKEDQQRVVCIKERDRAGKPTAKKLCLAGWEWESELNRYRNTKARTEERAAPRSMFFPQYINPGLGRRY
jgi:hypothetical protein